MTERFETADDAPRAPVLDALRGFALLGILVTHLPEFSGWEFLTPVEQAARDPSGLDRALGWVTDFVIRGKFLSLFALLFGIGFAIQLESAARRGADFRRRFLRRLGVLLAVGLVHGLVWYGDILRDYALLGLLLLPAAHWSSQETARVAALALAARLVWPAAVFAGAAWILPLAAAPADQPGDLFLERSRAFASDSWREVLAANGELLRVKALQLVYEGKAISIAALFWLGAAVGKRRLHADLDEARPILRRAFAYSLPLGLLGNLALVPLHAATPAYPPSPAWVLDGAVYAVAVPSLAIAYASGFALLFADARCRRWLLGFVPAGRLALTTYLSQTAVGIFLFYGVGFGLRGALGNGASIALAVPIFAAQSVLAAAWLTRFRFGPVEWCWRRLTYGTPVAMRR